MSSGLTPNSSNIERVGRGVAQEVAVWVNPEYLYNRDDWRKIRDVLAGQKEVKRKAELYLPKLKGMEDADYHQYLIRATFFNMTAQTQTGMIGQVFRKQPVIENLPARFADAITTRFSKDGAGYIAFAKTVLSEQIAMGRFGVLVDAPSTATVEPTSYVVGYATENILDWNVEEVNGTYQLTRVLLREFLKNDNGPASRQNPWIGTTKDPNSPNYRANPGQRGVSDGGNARNIASSKRDRGTVAPAGAYGDSYTYSTQYRELLLEQQGDGSYVYRQNVYKGAPNTAPTTTTIPVIRGKPLNFIPFKFFGSQSNTESVERSPMLDIADLNLSHYRTYAELEYGRLYTALPVYYAPGGEANSAAEYHIGPNTVWEVPSGEKPGILEYAGQGLKTLETALATKESQIASIGGRMLPGLHSVSESNNQTQLREANEQSVLLNCILTANFGITEVIRWWMMFRDVPMALSADIQFSLNQEFLSTPIGAREIRAVQLLYLDGIITPEVCYNYLRRAEVIPSNITLQDFKTMLKDPNSFINNPDAQARQRGFASRQQELDQAQIAREAEFTGRGLDIQDKATDNEHEFDMANIQIQQEKIDMMSDQGQQALDRQDDHGQQQLDTLAEQAEGNLKIAKQNADTNRLKAKAAVKQASKSGEPTAQPPGGPVAPKTQPNKLGTNPPQPKGKK